MYLISISFVWYGCTESNDVSESDYLLDLPTPADSILMLTDSETRNLSSEETFQYFLSKAEEYQNISDLNISTEYGLAAYHSHNFKYPDTSLAKLHKILSTNYVFLGDKSMPIEKLLLNGIKIYAESTQEPSALIGNLNMNLAIFYTFQEKYGKAAYYYELAKSIYNEVFEKFNHRKCVVMIGGARNLLELGNWQKSIEKFDEALTCLEEKQDSASITYRSNALSGKAAALRFLGELSQALHTNQKGIQLQELMNDFCSISLPVLYTEHGDIFLQMGKPDSSIYYFQKAIEVYECTQAVDKSTASQMINHLIGKKGLALLNSNKINEAIQCFDSVLVTLNYSASKPFTNIFGSKLLNSTLFGKAKAYRELMIENITLPTFNKFQGKAKEQYDELLAKLLEARNLLFEGTGRIAYININKDYLADAISFYRHLGQMDSNKGEDYIQKCLLISELSHSMYMYESMSLNSFSLPLRDSIASLTSQIELNEATDIEQRALINKRELFREELLKKFNLKDGLSFENLNSFKEIHEYCKENQAVILEYFASKDEITCFFLNGDTTIISSIKNKPFIVQESRNFIKSLSNKNSSTSDIKNIGLGLYDQLIKPFEPYFENVTGLIIIPDEFLYNLPFGALTMEDNNYLIQKFKINYQYSIQLLKKQLSNQNKKKYKNEFSGFAPSFFGGQSEQRYVAINDKICNQLSQLEFNADEVSSIAESFRGKLFLNRNATLENFLQIIGNTKIIHLATHAVGDEEIGAYLILANEEGDCHSISEEAIYNLNVDCKLVVLSACQSGIGVLNLSEGTQSLSRGFFHAGAESVLATLWEVNDYTSPLFMRTFYLNLKNGRPKNEALQKAQQEMIENEFPPFFWASYIITGSNQSLY